jgi:hypothetical protein
MDGASLGSSRLRTVHSLDELADLVQAEAGDNLYVRWSKGPDVDSVLGEAERLVDQQGSGEWGPMDRR